MEITEKNEIKTVSEIKTIAHYCVSEIEKLIIVDLEKLGYRVDKLEILMDYKTVTDDWGMNRHIETSFKGINATVELKGE